METQRDPKSWAMIAIFGPKVKPVEITAKLGIDPDYFQDSEIVDIENNPVTPHWQINSTLGPEAPLGEHIWQLLKRIAPARREMKEITSIHESCLYASVENASKDVKGIRLEKRVMLLLGELGINVEILPWGEEDFETFV
jgi:hypothetical protein